jgi:hypothetical protein
MRLPRLDVNQKLSIRGRSSCATRAELNRVSTSAWPFCGVMRATSAGLLALSQFAYSTTWGLRSGITRLVYEPVPTSNSVCTVPPFTCVEYSFS